MNLIIGAGGLGIRTAESVYKQLNDAYLCCLDTDIYSCESTIRSGTDATVINISMPGQALRKISATDNPLVQNIDTANGSGLSRFISNLCYTYSLKKGKFDSFFNLLDKISAECSANGQKLQISIITSLVGGTGAGIFLQVALLVRDYISTRFPNIEIEIDGHFALYGIYSAIVFPKHIMYRMKASAYASLKELNNINSSVMNYGYCEFKFKAEESYVTKIPFDKFYLYGIDEPADEADIRNNITQLLSYNNDEFYSAVPCFSQENSYDLSGLGILSYNEGSYHKAYQAVVKNSKYDCLLHLSEQYVNRSDIGETAYNRKNGIHTNFDSKVVQYRLHSQFNIFISYSTKNSVLAEQLRNVLETNGLDCWMAPTSIPPGSDYCFEIPVAIKNCNVVVLVLSAESQVSNWVPREVGCAISKGKALIPFRIDESDLNDAFDFMLSNSQRIEAYNRLAEAYKELLDTLFALEQRFS